MKLRIRSLESKQTTKIEVPTSSSLQQLRDAVRQTLSSPSSSSSLSPATVRLSLNRNDELVSSSSHDSLQSLGIISGDLVFFTLNPNAFSPQTLAFDLPSPNTVQQKLDDSVGGSVPVGSFRENPLLQFGDESMEPPHCPQTSDETLALELKDPKRENPILIEEMEFDGGSIPVGSSLQNPLLQFGDEPMEPPQTSDEAITLELKDPKGENPILFEEMELMETQNATIETNQGGVSGSSDNNMEIDDDDDGGGFVEEIEIQNAEQSSTVEPNQGGVSGSEDNMEISVIEEERKSFSVPSFLRKVFDKEVGEGGGGNHKLLVIAVHAILIESGFVGFNPVSKTIFEGFHIPADQWPSSSAFALSLFYTIPEVIASSPNNAAAFKPVVALKFQTVGKHVNVYGSLANHHGSGPYHVSLDEDRAAFLLNLIWANCDDDSVDEMMKGQVFEFWKTVKDGLALPLLIDLCEHAGFALPPCFMRLPADVKLKIMETLPGNEVAKMGCVNSELRYLSSNEDLWKQKFVEKFGGAATGFRGSTWKTKFASETRKRRRKAADVSREQPRRPFRREGLYVPRVNPYYPVFFRLPVIGGHHDLYGGLPMSLSC